MIFNVELRKPSNFNIILKTLPVEEERVYGIHIYKDLGGLTKINSWERPKKVHFIKLK